MQASGFKHIGFGPMKKQNQDEYFLQVGNYGGQAAASCYCIFDGHGSYGHHAAGFVLKELPSLLDQYLSAHFNGSTVGDLAWTIDQSCKIDASRHVQQIQGCNLIESFLCLRTVG